jgi:hypothetical protein
MTTHTRSLGVVAVLVAAAACRHDSTAPQVNGNLAGSWTRSQNVPGSSYSFTLAVADTSVTGNGTFSIEAGASGTLSVSGAAHDSSAQLTMHTSIGQVQHYNATLVDANTLRGSFWAEGVPVQDPVVLTFVRTGR